MSPGSWKGVKRTSSYVAGLLCCEYHNYIVLRLVFMRYIYSMHIRYTCLFSLPWYHSVFLLIFVLFTWLSVFLCVELLIKEYVYKLNFLLHLYVWCYRIDWYFVLQVWDQLELVLQVWDQLKSVWRRTRDSHMKSHLLRKQRHFTLRHDTLRDFRIQLGVITLRGWNVTLESDGYYTLKG